MDLTKTIYLLCHQAIKQQFDKEISSDFVEINEVSNKKFGHYQCNSAMKLAKILKKSPLEIATAIKDYILQQDTNKFKQIEIAGPGFINFTFSKQYLSECVNDILHNFNENIVQDVVPKTVIIDFSSPNIAKEMHVGHLRSTIIGDCLARLLTFLGHEVLRLNHIGDWGTQFGMLIAYLKQKYTDFSAINLTLQELETYYRESKKLFDEDQEFKRSSQQEVVKLQSGEAQARAIWQKICEISRTAYNEIYKLLNIEIIDRGESFYNPYLPEVISILEQKGLIEISDNAKCVYLEGFTNRDGNPLPLIMQKSDGGYNYATTDLAAIKHRVEVEHGEWLIYVTDAGQSQHFQMVFAAAAKVGFYDSQKVRIDHVPFGVVLRPDGKKFKTRSGDTERLLDLINTAISKAKEILHQRNIDLPVEELNKLAKQLGINAIKYADLSNHRTSNYTFSYDRMLQFEGNTAAFLAYAYVRIQSVKNKTNIKIQDIINSEKIELEEEIEIDLALKVCQFSHVLRKAANELLPHRITDYLFGLAENFHAFFHKCRVKGHAKQNSRLLLCEAVSKVLSKGLGILGLTALEKM